jgi:hypothetical protein
MQFPDDLLSCLCYDCPMNRGRTYHFDLPEILLGLSDLFTPVSGLGSAWL